MEPGTARGQWGSPRQLGATCTPSSAPLHAEPKTCTHTHTLVLAFSLGLSLFNTGRIPPHTHTLCVRSSPSQSLFLFPSNTHSLTHTLACSSSSGAHCEDDCLWTDIYDTGRMCCVKNVPVLVLIRLAGLKDSTTIIQVDELYIIFLRCVSLLNFPYSN